MKKLHSYSFFLESWHGNERWIIKKNAASVRAVFSMQLCTPLLPFLPEKTQKQSTIEFLAEARFVTLCKFQMIYPLINISWI